MSSAALPQLDQFDFHHRLARTPGLAVVLFSAAACASCRYWHRLLTDYARGRSLTVFEVDVGHDQALAREFEVLHLPALFLYRDGHFHAPLQCAASAAALDAAIAAALAAPAQEPP